jgi:hypothetical protein
MGGGRNRRDLRGTIKVIHQGSFGQPTYLRRWEMLK